MKKIYFAAAVMAALAAIGCDPGKAPAGMSENDAKSAIQNMKPEDRIRAIASSPLPGPQKEAEYRKIEQESGVKASDVLGGNAGLPGAGQSQ